MVVKRFAFHENITLNLSLYTPKSSVATKFIYLFAVLVADLANFNSVKSLHGRFFKNRFPTPIINT